MMVSFGIYVRRWQRTLRRWIRDPRLHALAQTAGLLFCGFSAGAASLLHTPQPLAMGLLCAFSGWHAVLVAMGGFLGYLVFWGSSGYQGLLWLAVALPAATLLRDRHIVRQTPWLLPVLMGLLTALSGLLFQLLLNDGTPIAIYLLRIGVAILSARLFFAAQKRDPVLEWILCAVAVLALAQIRPIPYFGFGFLAAGFLAAGGAFPAAALAGLALDLAQVSPVPMTAVLSLAYLMRLIPGLPRWSTCFAAGAVYLLVMSLCGLWDIAPVPALIVGGLLSLLLPMTPEPARRRGETGFAQVRLELAASVLSQTRNLLQNVEEYPIDEQALMVRAGERACSGCPCRSKCKEDPGKLPTSLLHKPLGTGSDLPLTCRKTGRLLQELRRSQEQLRAIRADRDRRMEYRSAVVQQYRFLSEYLQNLSSSLANRGTPPRQLYQPEVAVCSASRDGHNGDRCFWFAGVECKYYVLLCDGMGTGAEAARDGKLAGNMLRKLLCAGFPPEYALRSINSFCALQDRAGAVTIDLAELQLDTGKATLYKWGAAPSYVVHRGEAIKIGTAAPPPGLSVADGRETVEQLSLRRGETLILLSDGAEGEEDLRLSLEGTEEPPGELAARILDGSRESRADDATVAVVRLHSLSAS